MGRNNSDQAGKEGKPQNLPASGEDTFPLVHGKKILLLAQEFMY
jgi:hypothetical protein